MSPVFGKTSTVLVLVATVAVGYAAWETRNLKASLDRMAVGNETRINEMMLALAHTEGQLARIRETVELLDGTGPDTGQGAVLEGRIATTLTAAQREVLQQELSKWTRQLQDQREKGLAALRQNLEQKLNGNAARAEERDKRWRELKALVQQNQKRLTAQVKELGSGLSSPSGAMEEQGAALTKLEKRLEAVLEATQKGRQALNRQDQRDEKRWEELLLTLQENMEATQQRYAELAARLDQRGGAGQTPAQVAQPAEPATQTQQGGGGPDLQAEQERLAEFCAEVPQSDLCRNR